MNSYGTLFLSVDHKGQLRIWSSSTESRDKKGPTEVSIEITLTKPQIVAIVRAEQVATEKDRLAKGRTV